MCSIVSAYLFWNEVTEVHVALIFLKIKQVDNSFQGESYLAHHIKAKDYKFSADFIFCPLTDKYNWQ